MPAHGNCPDAEASDCWTAHVVADHLEQGWAKLCNGVIVFDDGFFIAPDGHVETIRETADAPVDAAVGAAGKALTEGAA